jgi:hypothetical protein
MTKQQIQNKITELESLKLPQLNKKSRAHHDWKLELEKLRNQLNNIK